MPKLGEGKAKKVLVVKKSTKTSNIHQNSGIEQGRCLTRSRSRSVEIESSNLETVSKDANLSNEVPQSQKKRKSEPPNFGKRKVSRKINFDTNEEMLRTSAESSNNNAQMAVAKPKLQIRNKSPKQ